ncbi:MAG TPA: pirin family protein, partial [Bacteroidia bacterium]|nr:pirin family protein [Bacteroidia bacterium]
MKKKIIMSSKGHRADIGELTIARILPNWYSQAVGPFVFLDHVLPKIHPPKTSLKEVGHTGAHPHRGIATLTYVMNGEVEHTDSKGHRAKVNSGGIQWMKAGNGIIHEEALNIDPLTTDRLTHGFQFWINLPSKNKTEAPEYIPMQANEVPVKELNDSNGWLKIIAGEYDGQLSKIPAYTKQFLYHIHLDKGSQFSLSIKGGLECAAFLPLQNAIINGEQYGKEEFIEFDKEEGLIDISGTNEKPLDILVFGGEPYTEPFVSEGPFVMNTHLEIAEAYKDFYAGKYGDINQSQ